MRASGISCAAGFVLQSFLFFVISIYVFLMSWRTSQVGLLLQVQWNCWVLWEQWCYLDETSPAVTLEFILLKLELTAQAADLPGWCVPRQIHRQSLSRPPRTIHSLSERGFFLAALSLSENFTKLANDGSDCNTAGEKCWIWVTHTHNNETFWCNSGQLTTNLHHRFILSCVSFILWLQG